MRNKSNIVMVCLLLVIISFFSSVKGYAGTYNNAITFYDRYGEGNAKYIKQDEDTSDFWFSTRGKKASSSSTMKFNVVGYYVTLKVNGTNYKIGLAYDESIDIIDERDGTEDGVSYVYNLKKVSFEKLMERFQSVYQNINFNNVYDQNIESIFTFDAIMITLIKNSNGSWISSGSVKEKDSDQYGLKTSGTLYTTQASIKKIFPSIIFTSFFEIDCPVESKPKFIDTNPITMQNGGSCVYQPNVNSNAFYVKKDFNFVLNFTSNTLFATDTFQPNANYFQVHDGSGLVQTIGLKTPNGAGVISYTGYYSVTTPLAYSNSNQTRTNNRMSLTSNLACHMMQDTKAITVYPLARAYLGGSIIGGKEQSSSMISASSDYPVSSKGITLVCDGSIPTIIGTTAFGWRNQNVHEQYRITDAGSGLRATEIYRNGIAVNRSNGSLLLNETQEGANHYYIYACDNVSNEAGIYVSTYIDKTPPIIGGQTDYNWTKDNVVIRLQASDALSGLADFRLYDGAGKLVDYGSSMEFTVATEGISTFTAQATDVAGNVTTQTVKVRIDKTPPTISGQKVYGWTNKDVSINLHAADSLTGVAKISLYDSSMKLIVSDPSDINTTISKEGILNYTAYAYDGVGNIATQTITVKLDKTAPVITGQTDFGWTNKDIRLDIKAHDTLSGMSKFEFYSYKNGTMEYLKSSASDYVINWTISVNGVWVYKVYAYDIAGNRAEKTITGKIDKISPIITGETEYGWTKNAVTINLQATDAQSGMSNFYLQGNSHNTVLATQSKITSTVTAEGITMYTAYASDIAGNISTKTVTVRIDKSPPTFEGKSDYAWATSDSIIDIKGIDSLSGMSKLLLYNSSGNLVASGISEVVYTVKTEGISTYTVYAYDVVGNYSSKKITVRIDTIPPVITGITNTQWTKNNITIDLQASDALSGMSCIVMYNDVDQVVAVGNSRITGTITKEGLSEYNAYAYDIAGNVASKSLNLRIDRTAPTGTVSNEYDGTILPIKITNVVEKLSGVYRAWIEIYDKSNPVQVWSCDLANVSGNYSAQVYLDFLCPFADVIHTDVKIIDYAGNERLLEQRDFDVFNLSASITRELSPHEPNFQCGEKGILSIQTSAYVNSVKITFPTTFTANSSSNSLNTQMSLAPRYTSNIEYPFVVPLKNTGGGVNSQMLESGDYRVAVTAYKNGRQKTVYPKLTVIGTIQDDFRTRIRLPEN